MANPVKWSDNKAGYDPGQKQELSVSFSSREIGKVTVSYKFYAKSLGYDGFVYKERHNKVTIWVGGTSTSFTYQLHGNKASTTKTGSFSITGVANGITSLKVEYKNDRIWVNKPQASWSPRSTGVVSKKKIGDLTISDNVKYIITYNQGYNGGKIVNVPSSSNSVYKGTGYYIPGNILTDEANHYVFINGYSTGFTKNLDDSKNDVNIASVGYKINSYQTLSNNITYYACWKPQTYIYKFFTATDGDPIDHSELKTTYTYSKPATTLPDLNSLSDNNSNVASSYYKVGYEFKGWKSNSGELILKPTLECTIDSDTLFYSYWQAITSKVIFNYNFDDYIREVSYTYDSAFDFGSVLKNKYHEAKSNTMLRPGYKLVGWTYNKNVSDIIYEPFKAPDIPYKFDSKTNIIYPNKNFSNREFIDNGLILYAVWEYYTTVYVYDNGSWKLALPYVYINKDGILQWNIALTYGYTNINSTQNPSWKL